MTHTMKRILYPLSFFTFVAYIIFRANRADYNFAFYVVGSIPYGDKIAHALLFGVMAYLFNYGLKHKSFKIKKLTVPVGSTIVLLFATIEEISQYFIPSRTFDIFDLLADIVGVILFSMTTKGAKR